MGNTASPTVSPNNITILKKIDGINLGNSKIIDQDSNRIFISLPLNFNQIFDGSESKFKSILYDKNRPIDKIRSSNIANSIENYKNFHWGTITIGIINGNTSRPYLLDGQHRIWATTTMEVVFNAHLQIIYFDDINEMHDAFIDLNQGVPLPKNYKTSHQLVDITIPIRVYNNIVQYWKMRTGDNIDITRFIKTSNNPHAPNISKHTLMKMVSFLLKDTEAGMCEHFFIRTDPELTSQHCLKLLYEFNESYSDKVANYAGFRWPSGSDSNKKTMMLNICKEHHFWLGYLKNLNNNLLAFTRLNFYRLFPLPEAIDDEALDDEALDDEAIDDEALDDEAK